VFGVAFMGALHARPWTFFPGELDQALQQGNALFLRYRARETAAAL
tara:strand:- start:147 stop:284 length:138 start_codon:yes stop_codon:yes gene_type:complete